MDLPPKESREEKKRKQIMEAATGPAWGAQSFAAVKTIGINKAMLESGKDPGFGDFGRYFSEKKRKLTEQYHKESTTSFSRDVPTGVLAPKLDDKSSGKAPENVSKRLFNGICIFVDGFTNPTHQELRFLMMNHGGVFENYFTTQRVTHVICSFLPDSKIMNPRLLSRGLPIVKPEWIVDSIKENKLLPWSSYQLDRIAFSHPHQRTITSAFSGENLSSSSAANSARSIMPIELEESTFRASEENAEQPRMHGVDATYPQHEPRSIELDNNEALTEDKEQKAVDVNKVTAFQSKDGSDKAGLEMDVGQQRLEQAPVFRRGRSTLDDPDFVQSYFKSSRLHFIGTWRNRYQSLVNSGKFGNPEQKLEADHALQTSSGRSGIIHVDMDCFFVSVIVRNRPDLVGKPVAVCHSDSARGTGEISSANYAARAFGVKAGSFVRTAKALCPDLAIVPYDFAAYEQVADMVYSIFHKYCSTVQAVSCDEAYLDVSFHSDPVKLASTIREEIFQATMCTASAGIAENLLLARLATKKAKPNGQFHIRPDQVKEFMAKLPVDELPGVGWTLRDKLHDQGVYTCSDVLMKSKEALQRDYGAKTGIMLWSYAQGIDDKEVVPAQERKSIGAEVNWGVRFKCSDDAQQFLVTLSNEVATRMQKASSSGRTITLKVKRRKEGYTEPVKFMGCGVCDNLSRSETVASSTNSADVFLRISRQLFASLHLDVQEVRGVGLQVSRLESSAGTPGSKQKLSALDSWLAPATKSPLTKEFTTSIPEDDPSSSSPEPETKHDTKGKRHLDFQKDPDFASEAEPNQPAKPDLTVTKSIDRQTPHNFERHTSARREGEGRTRLSPLDLPPLSQLDRTVLEHLPEDIVAEINDATRAQEELKARQRAAQEELNVRKEAQEKLKARQRAAQEELNVRKEAQEKLKARERAREELKSKERAQELLKAQEELKSKERAREELKARETTRGQRGKKNFTKKSHQPRLFPKVQSQQKQQTRSTPSRSDDKPRNAFSNLPPKSELDPSVLESLPNDILEEINQAYLAQESLRLRSREKEAERLQDSEALQSKTDADVDSEMATPTIDRRPDGTASHYVNQSRLGTTTSKQVDLRGKSKVLDTFTGNDFPSRLEHILNRPPSNLAGQNLATQLLSIGCVVPLEGDGHLRGMEHLIQKSNEQLVQHAQVIASRDLEQLHSLILSVKRLGSRCKFWRAVQEHAVSALNGLVTDIYGGSLHVD